MTTHEPFMRRCLQLAKLGTGFVAPNPLVGAVLVNENRIIGEGYHRKFGEAHAEVNCIANVPEQWRHQIPKGTLYVNLEPCHHFGKTPPCTDLILDQRIQRVIVGMIDPFDEVKGRGVEKLRAHGVEVVLDVLADECRYVNRRFITFHTLHRPFIILKWAQTANGRIANTDLSRLHITNEISNRLVHKWRSEESSILIGTNTALSDNPFLTTRLWPGSHPTRLVLDMDLRLPSSLRLFDNSSPTVVFNSLVHEQKENVLYYQITKDVEVVHQIVHALYHLRIQSVIVEGGSRLIQAFIDADLWDEAIVLTNESLVIEGLPSPVLRKAQIADNTKIFSDKIERFVRPTTNVI